MHRCIHALIHRSKHGATVTALAISLTGSVATPALAQNPVLRDIEVRSFLGEPLNLRIALAASTEIASSANCQSVIDADPRENRNLAADPAQAKVIEELKQLLRAK